MNNQPEKVEPSQEQFIAEWKTQFEQLAQQSEYNVEQQRKALEEATAMLEAAELGHVQVQDTLEWISKMEATSKKGAHNPYLLNTIQALFRNLSRINQIEEPEAAAGEVVIPNVQSPIEIIEDKKEPQDLEDERVQPPAPQPKVMPKTSTQSAPNAQDAGGSLVKRLSMAIAVVRHRFDPNERRGRTTLKTTLGQIYGEDWVNYIIMDDEGQNPRSLAEDIEVASQSYLISQLYDLTQILMHIKTGNNDYPQEIIDLFKLFRAGERMHIISDQMIMWKVQN